jgi:hypothetical protein
VEQVVSRRQVVVTQLVTHHVVLTRILNQL